MEQIYLQSEAIEYIETLCKFVSWAQTMNYYIGYLNLITVSLCISTFYLQNSCIGIATCQAFGSTPIAFSCKFS